MNTIDPNPSSTLEVYSENMGITMPNVSLSSYTDYYGSQSQRIFNSL